MPLIPDKKKAVTVILSRMHPDGMDEHMEPEQEGGDDAAIEAIASEMMSAIKAGDVPALVESLKSFLAFDDAKDIEREESELE